MDAMQEYIEMAYEERKRQRAAEEIKEIARKNEIAERDALLENDMRKFVAGILPMEILPACFFPRVQELLATGYGSVTIDLEGCVAILLNIRYLSNGKEFAMGDFETPFDVAGLEILSPYFDGEDVCEGVAKITWSNSKGPNMRHSCKDAREAIGLARERWLMLARADAGNKREYDALVLLQREKTAATEAETEYVPLVEEVTPDMVFHQALREYVYDLVDERWKFLAAAVNCYE